MTLRELRRRLSEMIDDGIGDDATVQFLVENTAVDIDKVTADETVNVRLNGGQYYRPVSSKGIRFRRRGSVYVSLRPAMEATE